MPLFTLRLAKGVAVRFLGVMRPYIGEIEKDRRNRRVAGYLSPQVFTDVFVVVERGYSLVNPLRSRHREAAVSARTDILK